MPVLSLQRKLEVLADAAKYDASCASSSAPKRTSRDGKGVGATDGHGICHAFTPDGRCVSLLKVLLTNFCVWDCAYCVNRVSSNVPRARFSIAEIVGLTLDFYRRNYIEGLFLSSGVIRSADYTMEQLVLVAKTLRQDHDFRGYIHLKVIPEASPELVHEAGLWADRLSANIEMPRAEALEALAPEKSAPAVQSTQMIVGADGADDAEILARSETLYGAYKLRRVYFSAFSPIPDSSSRLPLQAAPLLREHRLYQADWLMRFYGFDRREIASAAPGGMLDLEVDPKLAWALANRERFPVDVNRAEREQLLRVPGLGVKSVDRIVDLRRHKRVTLHDVAKLCRGIAAVRPFLVAADWSPGGLTDSESLRAKLVPAARRAPVQPRLL